MVSEKIRMPPVFVISGILVFILFGIVMILSTYYDGTFIFGHDMISCLGHSKNPDARMIFNYGCVLVGVLGMFFAMGLMARENNWLYMSGLLMVISSLGLMGIGSIPDTILDPHELLTKIFGAAAGLAMITSVIGDYAANRKLFAGITIALLLLSLLTLVICEFGLFEFTSVVCIAAWIVSQSFKYLFSIGCVEYDNPINRILKRGCQ